MTKEWPSGAELLKVIQEVPRQKTLYGDRLLNNMPIRYLSELVHG